MFTAIPKIWLINISLAALIILAGVMSYQVWMKTDETVPEVQTAKSSEKPQPVKTVVERTVPPESTFGVVAEKNLFSANRSESVPDKQGPGQLTISEKALFLYGVILMGDNKQALVTNPSPPPKAGDPPVRDKWVKIGDTMGNFSVADIKKDRIVITDGARRHEVLLYDKNKPTRRIVAAAAASEAPTVIGAAQAPAAPAVPAKPAAEASASRAEAGKSAAADEYVTINTPFGPVKRKVR